MTRVDMQQTNAKPAAESAGFNGESNQFLTFQLAGEVYAIAILHIREIIEYGSLTAVPMVPDFIAGVINLRGSVVPVIDLGARFGRSVTKITKRTSIVVIEIADGDKMLEIGITVDLVNEVLEIAGSDIEAAPSFGASIRTDFIAGMGKVNGQFMILLDVQRVLSIDELSVVGRIHSNGDRALDRPCSTEPH
ncbi:MAG: chemotaxis protein CheW [Methylococcaceae bacterium]|nr:chemotaxis protein CheW [Methylococcaceae bacterium]